jgi:hypothetical protein
MWAPSGGYGRPMPGWYPPPMMPHHDYSMYPHGVYGYPPHPRAMPWGMPPDDGTAWEMHAGYAASQYGCDPRYAAYESADYAVAAGPEGDGSHSGYSALPSQNDAYALQEGEDVGA